RLRQAVHEQPGVDRDREQEIGDRPGHHDRKAPPHALAVEGAVGFACFDRSLALVEHLDVATERNRRDHPFRLIFVDCLGHQRTAKTHRKAQHLDAAQPRNQVMAVLVDHDEQAERHDEGDEGMQQGHAAIANIRVDATLRASVSAAMTAARSSAARAGTAESVSAITPAMPVNGSRRSRNASTATSLAAFSTAGAVPPARSASYARPRHGKRFRSGFSNDRPRTAARSSDLAPESMRSGQASACAIGTRMSGFESCAIIEPSWYSTSECTMLCGWISTSMRSGATSNSQRASITSRPLFIMVAESTEILRPITQFGCAHAWSGVTVASISGGAVRNGPPEAVRMILRTPLRSEKHWNTALCSLSIGRSVAPERFAASITSAPPMTSASLLASSTRRPARTAASVDGSPAAPTIAAMTTSDSRATCSSALAPNSSSVFAFENSFRRVALSWVP